MSIFQGRVKCLFCLSPTYILYIFRLPTKTCFSSLQVTIFKINDNKPPDFNSIQFKFNDVQNIYVIFINI